MANDLTELYTKNPGTTNVADTQDASATAATSSTSEGLLSQAKTQDVPKENLASSQLNDITSQSSPLMTRARQEGMLLAARRGLQNSSLAAGAAEGALVDRATPIAQTNAAQLQEQSLANQTAENDNNKFNAQLGTQNNQFNAGLETDVSKQNADLTTKVSQQNAQQKATNAQQNAAATNTMSSQVLQANSDLNKQYLAGQQSMDLATIQGRYQQLISANETAANLYQSYFNSIGQVMANKDIPPDRVAQLVNVQQSMLEAGLRMMDQMNSVDLGNFQLPGATGTSNSISPTPGSGITETPTPTPVAPSPTVTPTNGTIDNGNIYLGGKWIPVTQLYGGIR